MRWLRATRWILPLPLAALQVAALQVAAQAVPPPGVNGAQPAVAVPLPDPKSLLEEVERHQRQLETLERDYTYHVHTDEQELDKQGGVKKAETEDAESLTVDGVRVNRVVARNGKPLTPAEQQKESERLDKQVARARERRSKVQARGGETDERGDEVMPLSRILELGSFSNSRREMQNGRPVILLDYAGNPRAKTHSAFEGIMRDVVGTVWIDEADRVLIAAQGHFVNDFKLGGGLLADVRKGTSFDFKTARVGEAIWLPAEIHGQGTVRVLLFANFSGRMHVTTSDYKRFRTSAVIVGSHGAIGADGQPLPEGEQTGNPPEPAKPH